MNILYKLAALFTIIFAFCVVLTLLIILIYALSKHKRFQQQQRSINIESRVSYNKKSQQPQLYPPIIPPSLTEAAPDSEHDDVEECWQALYGNSMLLYTIKEEDKEGSEISTAISGISSTEGKKRWLAARISGENSPLAAVDEIVEPETPYYTPSGSPENECISIMAEYGSGEEDGADNFRINDFSPELLPT